MVFHFAEMSPQSAGAPEENTPLRAPHLVGDIPLGSIGDFAIPVVTSVSISGEQKPFLTTRWRRLVRGPGEAGKIGVFQGYGRRLDKADFADDYALIFHCPPPPRFFDLARNRA